MGGSQLPMTRTRQRHEIHEKIEGRRPFDSDQHPTRALYARVLAHSL